MPDTSTISLHGNGRGCVTGSSSGAAPVISAGKLLSGRALGCRPEEVALCLGARQHPRPDPKAGACSAHGESTTRSRLDSRESTGAVSAGVGVTRTLWGGAAIGIKEW